MDNERRVVHNRRSGNTTQEKSYAFAARVVRLYQHLSKHEKEFLLSKQVLGSGASKSLRNRTLLLKMDIAFKEARETNSWLRLLKDSGYIQAEAFEFVHQDCQELLKLLYTLVKSPRNGK